MLSSTALAELIPDALWRRYSDIETAMILAYAERVRSTDFLSIWSSDRARAASILRSDIEEIINKNKTGIKRDLSEAISTTGNRTLQSDEAHYLRGVEAGLLPDIGTLSSSVVLNNIMATAYSNALNKLNLTNTMAVNTVSRRFDDLVLLATSGKVSIDAAIKQSVNDFASEGVTLAQYEGGRQMEIAAYTRMIVRTETNSVAYRLGFARAEEYGSDLIEISAHAGARPLCFPYQGRVFSISGNSETFPAFSTTSYGEPAGIFGINCGHFPTPFLEGIDRVPTVEERDPAATELNKSNDQVYRESQQQRANERQIRKWKRRVQALEEAGLDANKAKQKVTYWQARQRHLIGETDRTRRYSRERA